MYSMNENDDNEINSLPLIKSEEPMSVDVNYSLINIPEKNTCNPLYEDDNKEIENLLEVKVEEVSEEINLNEINDPLMDISEEMIDDPVFENDCELRNMLGIKLEETVLEKANLHEICDSLIIQENDENMSFKNDSDQTEINESNSSTNEYNNSTKICHNSTLSNESSSEKLFIYIPVQVCILICMCGKFI